jgi:hypothetical protein
MSYNTNLGELINAAYMPQKQAVSYLEKRKLRIDPELSKMDTKVFVDDTGAPLILHRGSNTVKDWIDDSLLAVGLGKYGHRYKEAQRITKKAENKYGRAANTVGDSYGGWLAENSGSHGSITTFNKAAGLADIGTKKNSKRQKDIRVSGDVVSYLSTTQRANRDTIERNKNNRAHTNENLFY